MKLYHLKRQQSACGGTILCEAQVYVLFPASRITQSAVGTSWVLS